MNTGTFIAAAGVDPYAVADEIVDARPGEVAALGEAFLAAAAELAESGSLAALADELANAGTVFDGAAPTDLMLEVSAVRASLNAGPQQLLAIGGPLCELAGALATVQLGVGDVLAAMEEQCLAVVLQHQALAASALTAPLDLSAQHVAKGAGVVQAAHQQVSALVDQHDVFTDSILAGLQSAGYLIPGDVDAAAVDTDPATGVPRCPPLPTGGPQAVAAWWAARSAGEQVSLITDHPELIAALPGLPAPVYDLINRRELADGHADVQAQIDAWMSELQECGAIDEAIARNILGSAADLPEIPGSELARICEFSPEAAFAIATLVPLWAQKAKITATQDSVADGPSSTPRYLLEYELDSYGGDGTAVIAIGEVQTADNVAVLVQGATHDLASIDDQTVAAAAVLEQMNALGGDDANAVIVWEGYDNPSVLEAVSTSRAKTGAHELVDDLQAYAATQVQAGQLDAHTTLIGHSYGTVLASYALQHGATELVDDVVIYGSPGLVVGHVTELGMPAAHVYAAMAPSDILVSLDNFERQVAIPFLGPDPASAEFGTIVLGTQGVDDHGDYFGYEDGVPNDALHNAGAIASGAYEEIRPEN